MSCEPAMSHLAEQRHDLRIVTVSTPGENRDRSRLHCTEKPFKLTSLPVSTKLSPQTLTSWTANDGVVALLGGRRCVFPYLFSVFTQTHTLLATLFYFPFFAVGCCCVLVVLNLPGEHFRNERIQSLSQLFGSNKLID